MVFKAPGLLDNRSNLPNVATAFLSFRPSMSNACLSPPAA
jgi:hypothetical protein